MSIRIRYDARQWPRSSPRTARLRGLAADIVRLTLSQRHPEELLDQRARNASGCVCGGGGGRVFSQLRTVQAIPCHN